MSLSVAQMRRNIKLAQPGRKGTGVWVDLLTNSQVIAIHARLVRESKIKI